MSFPRKIALSIWILAACALLLAWRLERATRFETEGIRRLSRDLGAAESRDDRLRERLGKAAALEARLEAQMAASQRAGEDRRGSGRSWLEMLRSDLSVQARYLAYQRSGFIMTYGPLFRQLGLSPEQISRCEDILAQREEDRMDLDSTLEEKGLEYGDPAAQAIRMQQESAFGSAQKALLGDAGYAQLVNYDQTIPDRMAATGIAGAATMAGVPLTTDQMQKLTELMVQSEQGNYALMRDTDGSVWSGMDNKASAFLTPGQVDLMRSGEYAGPLGYGTRYQNLLNAVISVGFKSDADAMNANVANSQNGGSPTGGR